MLQARCDMDCISDVNAVIRPNPGSSHRDGGIYRSEIQPWQTFECGAVASHQRRISKLKRTDEQLGQHKRRGHRLKCAGLQIFHDFARDWRELRPRLEVIDEERSVESDELMMTD